LGEFKKACDYYEEASTLVLDLYSVKKAAEISGLNKKFEDELITQEESKNTAKRIMFGSLFIIVILFVGAGLFLKHRDQVKLNEELFAKNELISKQKEQLTQSNAAKDKFFSILSHDLRNPLNGLLGFSKILEMEFDNIKDDEKKEYIGYIKSSSESLNKLIDKTLMWSRLQTGKIQVYKEKINLHDIAATVVELQKVNAIRKGIILDNNISDDIFVSADKNIVDTVIRNLIDNAIKFTEAGGKVIVNADIINNNVELSITDTGVGMSETHLQKLFKIDEKISSAGTRNEEGSGLGLILCKEMLVLMNSDLKVDSTVSEGSKFYFTLPLVN
jgi:signal transduction histidine kinase